MTIFDIVMAIGAAVLQLFAYAPMSASAVKRTSLSQAHSSVEERKMLFAGRLVKDLTQIADINALRIAKEDSYA